MEHFYTRKARFASNDWGLNVISELALTDTGRQKWRWKSKPETVQNGVKEDLWLARKQRGPSVRV
jgi:hypothetical protein